MSKLVWTYEGGADGTAEAAFRGQQCARPGDTIIDDVFGEGTLDKLDGGKLHVQFDMGGGDLEMKARTAGHVRAKAQPR